MRKAVPEAFNQLVSHRKQGVCILIIAEFLPFAFGKTHSLKKIKLLHVIAFPF